MIPSKLFDLLVEVRVDAKRVSRQLRDLERQGESTSESFDDIGGGAERSQRKATGAFGRIARGLRTLRGDARRGVDVNVNVDASGLDAAERRLSGLSDRNVRVTVDAETGGAMAGLSSVDSAADRLDGRDIDARVDVDTGGAVAQLAMFRAAATAVSGAVRGMDSGLSAGGVRIAMIGGIAATAAALFTPLLGALASVGSLAMAAGLGVAAIAGPLVAVIGKLTNYHESLDKVATAEGQVATAAESHRTALDAVDAAETARQSALDQVIQATEDAARTQDEYNYALEDEPDNLILNELNRADALDRASDARRHYNETVREYGANSEEATDAARDLERAEAELSLQERETQRVRENGTEGLQAAEDAAQSAEQARLQANQGLLQANQQLAQSQEKAAQSLQDIAAAEQKVADETVTLSPALMGLYNTAMRFKDVADRAFMPAQNAVAGLAARILRDVIPSFGILNRTSVASIGALGRAWNGFVSSLKMPTQQASIGTLLGITPEVLQRLVSGVGSLMLAITNMLAAAAPAALSLARSFESAMNALLGWSGSLSGVNAVKASISAAVPVFRALWTMVKQVGGALYDFGVTNAPAIATAIRIVSGALAVLINGFSRLTQTFGPIVPITAALTPIFLGLMLIVGQLGSAVIGLIGAAAAIGPVFAAIGGVLSGPLVLGIAAAAAAVVLLVRNWDRIKAAAAPLMATLRNLGTVIKGLFAGSTGTEQFRRAFASLPGPVQTAVKAIVIAWRGLKTAFSQAWTRIRPILTQIASGIKTGLGTAFKFLVSQAKQALAAFKRAWPGIKNAVLPVIQAIARGLRTGLGAAFKFAISQAKVVVNWFKQNWPLIRRTAETVFNAVKTVVTTRLRQTWDFIKAVVGQLVRFWNANHKQITAILRAAWNSIKTVVSTVIKVVLGIIKATMQAITGDWRGAWNTIKNVLQVVWNAIKQLVKNSLTILRNLLQIAWKGIKALTSAAWEAIRKTIADKIDSARSRAKQVVTQLAAGLKTAWENIKKAASDAWSAISGAIWRPVETAYNKVTEFIGKILGAVNRVLEMVGLDPIGGGEAKKAPTGAGQNRGQQGFQATGGTGLYTGGYVTRRGTYELAERGPEYVINPARRDNAQLLRQANEDFTRRHRSGAGSSQDGSSRRARSAHNRARGQRGRQEGFGPATYTLVEPLKKIADTIAGRYNTPWNSYTNHPPNQPMSNQPYWRERSVDWWGSGGRGDPIGDVWTNVASDAKSMLGGNLEYMLDPNNDPAGHWDHVHVSAFIGDEGLGTATGSGAGGGGSGVAAAAFEAAWKRWVEPVVNTFLGPMKDSNQVLTQAAGAAAQKIPDGIKEWALEKLGAMGGSGSLPGGKSPGGLTLGEAVSQGGWPSSLQKTAVGVAWEESSAQADATNGQYRGLFQMGEAAAQDVGADYGKLFDPIYNSTAAADYYRKIGGWSPWEAYPPSSDSMSRGNTPVTGYDRGGLIKKEHRAILHPNEIVMPLDKPHVQNTFAALGINEMRQDFNRELQGLRRDMKESGIKVSGYGSEAREVIVVGAREGGLGAMGSSAGRRILKQQGTELGKLTRAGGRN